MARLGRGSGQGVRRTSVRRTAYWVPEDNGGKGGWRFLPTGATHKQMVEELDPETNEVIGTIGTYESKGWTSRRGMASDDPRLKILPSNLAEMERDHKAVPVFDKADAA